ncbi:hypothetical protein Godav_022769 [Gossypium davidsonii]|uniref:RNase H type-1 domain-containing protein n=1 Tax=Gossypium davidsonii TaxID=34287 RepID=A0A7J8SPI4_GOSDV|nr:hypothetical protein [Gossypium davidsonii]
MMSNFEYSVVVSGLFGLVEFNSYMRKRKGQELKLQGKLETIFQNLKKQKKEKLTLLSSGKFHQVFKRGRATVHFDAAFDRLQAVKLGISLGINILEVMGDSKTVIKKCQSSIIDRSVIGAIIRDIQSTKSNYQKVEFSFIPKVNNIYAHTIATEALKRGESFYLERGILEAVRSVLERLWLKPSD